MAPAPLFYLGQRHLSSFPKGSFRRRADCQAAVATAKSELTEALMGTNRGIFGMQSAKQADIHAVIERLECASPVTSPTSNLQALDGTWRVLYSTIRILGTKRSKLGLREFVKIGDIWQSIDSGNGTATNIVDFSVTGLGQLHGSLTIVAAFDVVSDTRVNVLFREATLAPKQLDQLFRKNYDLLLSIFNPAGRLDITYLDDDFRIGRDDKENIFVLERAEQHLVT